MTKSVLADNRMLAKDLPPSYEGALCDKIEVVFFPIQHTANTTAHNWELIISQ